MKRAVAFLNRLVMAAQRGSPMKPSARQKTTKLEQPVDSSTDSDYDPDSDFVSDSSYSSGYGYGSGSGSGSRSDYGPGNGSGSGSGLKLLTTLKNNRPLRPSNAPRISNRFRGHSSQTRIQNNVALPRVFLSHFRNFG